MQAGSPPGAMAFAADGTPLVRDTGRANYMQSKVGGCWLADEFAKRLSSKSILSVVGEFCLGISLFD